MASRAMRRSIGALMFGALAPLPGAHAQEVSGAPDLMALNRNGQWERVVQLGTRMLQEPLVTVAKRCETILNLTVAHLRLRQAQQARSYGQSFTLECATLPPVSWIRSEMRRTMDELAGDSASVASRGAGTTPVGATTELPPLPTTGVDFSSFDAFWQIAELLENDVDPTPSQWRAFWNTPGYRLLAQRGLTIEIMREDMDAAFRPVRGAPSPAAEVGELRVIRREHFRRARAVRPALQAFRDSLRIAPLVERAVARASEFLPAGATSIGVAPAVVFTMLGPDGFAGRDAVILDVMLATETDLSAFLGHEFHHTYSGRFTPRSPRNWEGADTPVAQRLMGVWTEGTADMVDKTFPLASPTPSLAPFTERYNADYGNARSIIARIDSLLAVGSADSTRVREIDRAMSAMLPFGGRVIGAYMARTVLETHGRDSLIVAVISPSAFFRLYDAAEQRRGNPSPWSPVTRGYLERLSRRYWR